MSKFLFVSRFGDSYGLAQKLARDGHKVKYAIEDRKYAAKGEGFKNPERVKFYEPHLSWADVIIFDMSGIGRKADALRRQGLPVIGASGIADKMESDREFAQTLMKKVCPSASIPEFKKFTSIKDGIKHIEANPDRLWVFKPDGMPTAWTFVPKEDNEAVLSVMRACPKQNAPFILQEKVSGIEISTEGWFDGKGWIPGAFNHTMEEKRFMDGGTGPNCGCAGSLVWKSGEDKLVKTFILPFTDFLKKEGYVGPFDVNAIVEKDTAHFLEFTPRFGYDAIQNLTALMADAGGFFMSAAGKGGDSSLADDYALSVRLSMPPYPASEDDNTLAESTKGLKTVSVPSSLADYAYLADVMENEAGETVMAGTDNVIGAIVALSDDIDDAMDTLYDDGLIEAITSTQDVQYRKDIGKGCAVEIARLVEWGWIKERG